MEENLQNCIKYYKPLKLIPWQGSQWKWFESILDFNTNVAILVNINIDIEILKKSNPIFNAENESKAKTAAKNL